MMLYLNDSSHLAKNVLLKNSFILISVCYTFDMLNFAEEWNIHDLECVTGIASEILREKISYWIHLVRALIIINFAPPPNV